MHGESVSDLLREGREHHRAGRLEAAEALYRQAIERDPKSAEPRLNLGVLLNEMARGPEGLEVLGQLVADYPKLAAGWVQLAHAIAPLGFGWEAHDAISRALKHKPDADTLVAASMLLTFIGDHSAAESVCRRALKMTPDNVSAWIHLGQILADNDRKAEAAAAYQRALAIEPQNAVAAFFHAALTAGASDPAAAPTTAPPTYVRQLFDGYAHRFDESLTGSLRYQAPRLLDELFSRWLTRPGADNPKPMTMLDAGCGTGLCGFWMSQYRGQLIGVDLSRKMVTLSQTRAVYDELIAGEIVEELQKRPAALDLIVAGDVLVYIGDLAPLFTAAAAALREGGVFLFSVEAAPDADYVLLPTQRFAHSRNYVTRLATANGLAVRVIEEGTLRQEKGSNVRGYFVLAQRIANDLRD